MGLIIEGVTQPRGLILAAASSASAATGDLIEASRADTGVAEDLAFREVAENLADALQSVCSVELERADLPADRREAIGQLLASVSRFVEGWA